MAPRRWHNLLSASSVLLCTAVALPHAGAAQTGSGEFSILDYLASDTIERTPEEWQLEAEAASDPHSAYLAYSRAVSALLSGKDAAAIPPSRIRNLRYAMLQKALEAALGGLGDGREGMLKKAREAARDMADPADTGWGYWQIAQTELRLDRPDNVRTLLRRTTQAAEALETSEVQSLLFKAAGETALKIGDVEFAAFQLTNMIAPGGRHQLARLVVQVRSDDEALAPEVRKLLGDSVGEAGTPENGVLQLLVLGEFDHAIELALTDDDYSEQGDMLTVVTKAAIDAKQLSAARLAALLNPDAGEATRAWVNLARAQSKQGYGKQADDALARALARATGPGGDESDIGQVAKAHIDFGNLDRAEDLLKPLSDASESVVEIKGRLIAARIEAGQPADPALTPTVPLPDAAQSGILASTALARARDGDNTATLEALGQITDEGAANEARYDVVEAMIERDDVSGVEAQIEAITDPVLAAEAVAKYAKWMVRNDDAPQGEARFTQLAESLAALPQEQANAARRKVAKTAAEAGLFDLAEAIATAVADPALRAEAIANMGAVVAQKAPDRALGYLEALSEVKQRDKLLGNIALGFARNHDIARAEEFARQIVEDKTRVTFMRKIAEEQALRLDTLDLLKASAPQPERFEFEAESVTPGPSYGTAKLFSIQAEPLTPRMPPPPQNIWTTAEEVMHDVEPIDPGRASVSLMRASYFTEKFIADIPGQTLLRHKQGRNSLQFIMVESGVFDIPSLYRRLRALGYDEEAIKRDGRIYTLRLPLLVMPEATLVISGADVSNFRMSDDRGAFITVAGQIRIADTVFETWREEYNQRAYRTYEVKKKFRPFLTIWTGGNVDVVNSTVFGLGYLGGKSYGLAMSAGPATFTKNRPMWEDSPYGRIVSNSFRNNFYAYYAYEAVDVAIVGNELVDNIVYGLDPHDRAQRLSMSFNTAYGTHKKHGLIVSREVDNSNMVGNVSFENHGSGYMLDRDSIQNLLYANTAFDNEQDGISFFESSCNFIVGNYLFDNKRDGIKLRNSWNLSVFGNQIEGHGAAGIDVYSGWLDPEGAHKTRDFELDPYFSFSAVELFDNTLSNNRAGLKFQGVNSAVIGSNHMGDQSPRLFAGDLMSLGGGIVSATLQGKTAGIAHQCAQPVPRVHCSFLEEGYLSGEGQNILEALNDTGRCVPDEVRPRGIPTAEMEPQIEALLDDNSEAPDGEVTTEQGLHDEAPATDPQAPSEPAPAEEAVGQ